MRINPYKSNARYIAVTGIMLGTAAALTSIESLLSAFLPAGMRIGLSNVVVMAALISVNAPTALIITVLKSAFVLLTRGYFAGVMSLSGGLPAFLIIFILFYKSDLSYIFISISGAVTHTAGQLCAACILTGSVYTLYYMPIMITTSIASGICTGVIVKTAVKYNFEGGK